MPAQVEVSTRSGHYSAWRGVVTWLLAHDSAYKGLPMASETLEALTMEWLIAGASVNTIKTCGRRLRTDIGCLVIGPLCGRRALFGEGSRPCHRCKGRLRS